MCATVLWAQRLGGMGRVQDHVTALSTYLHRELTSLRHSNGRPVVKCFGKWGQGDAREVQGGVVNFAVLDTEGRTLPYKTVEKEAATEGIHIRTGAHCNPGAWASSLGLR